MNFNHETLYDSGNALTGEKNAKKEGSRSFSTLTSFQLCPVPGARPYYTSEPAASGFPMAPSLKRAALFPLRTTLEDQKVDCYLIP